MSAPTPEDIGVAGVILTYIGGPHPDCRVHPARLPDDPCAECEVLAGARVIAKVRVRVRQQALLELDAEAKRLRAGIEHLTRVGYSHTPDCEPERKRARLDRHPDCGRCWEDSLHDLLNPTEGEAP